MTTGDGTTLKEQKEAFVTGHDGTTPHEILLVCLSAPIGVFLFNEIRCLLLQSRRKLGRGAPDSIAKAQLVAIESFVLLLPMAICQTRLLYPWGVSILCLEIVLGICVHNYRRMSRSSDEADNERVESSERAPTSHLTFLSSYRSTVSYLTFVAILAVDFHVFPRRFAKTETAGYGLMDLGAGSFIVSGGFVSWYARRKPKQSGGAGGEGERKSYLDVLRPVLIRCVPLVLLGTIRLVTNKGLEYQEHVSEYGAHWNFFFTLAVVGLLSSMIRFDGLESFGDNFIQKAFPFVILALHQTTLSVYEMQEYIENGQRQCRQGSSALCNFFAANREGILGSIGYLCMHFISEDIANYCLWSCPGPVAGEPPRKRSVEVERGQRLFASCALLWALHWVLSAAMQIPVSRRSTNASFVCWTLAHNVTILALIWAACYLSETQATHMKPAVSPIFDAVNRHGLIVFILANLMTGLVNLKINTLDVTDGQALGIIFGYLFAVGAVALIVDGGLSARKTKKD